MTIMSKLVKWGAGMFINRVIQKFRYRNSYKKGVVIAEFVELTGNTTLGCFSMIAHHASISNSEIGAYTSIGRYSKVRDSTIGRYCSISWDVTIGATSHPYNHITTHSFPYNPQFALCEKQINYHEAVKTVIGNDVWIGTNAIILPGISIGDGAVIGAGSVVTHDVEAYSIVGGVPARLIKYRFEKDIRERLSDLKWWNWSEEKLKSFIKVFSEDVTETLLNEITSKESFDEEGNAGCNS